MSGAVNLRMKGRFGNQLFQYAFARAYAKVGDLELRTEPWDGERLFNISHPRIGERFSTVRNEETATPGESNVELAGYFQMQRSLIYTRSQAREWLTWRPEVLALLQSIPEPATAFHIRRGDYFGYGYTIVSRASYNRAASLFAAPLGYDIVSEESATTSHSSLPPYTADFYRLTRASHLFRANSSFSWWAATIAADTQKVFSPVIDGLGSGEHECDFVCGNYPRLAHHDFTTDLHLAP